MPKSNYLFLLLIISLFLSNKALSQCGNILLTTQSDVDDYFAEGLTCSTVTGNLDIIDDGTDPITSLNSILFGDIVTINGDLRIENCNSLSNLNGLQNIKTIGFSLAIINNAILDDISALDDVETIGDRLEIAFTAIPQITSFNSLTSVSNSLLIYENASLTSITGFSQLTHVGLDLEVFNGSPIMDVSGFSNISSIGGDLGFSAIPLTGGLPDFPVGMTVGGNIRISNCGDISDISPLEDISTIGGDLIIENCEGITECCFLLDYPAISPAGSIILNNNGAGCSALSQVGAEPPVISGIPATNETISCDDVFPNIPTPTANDDCDGDVTADIMFSSNVTTSDCNESTASVHEYEWSVMDEGGNMTIEQWTVTVENDFVVDLGPDILECGLSSADLQPDVSGVSYEWSTGETTAAITVEGSGIYEVTVTSASGCCASDMIEVGLYTVPEANASGGSLGCDGLMLEGSSTIANVDYSWEGPNGFTSNEQNPTINVAGQYTLTVTTDDGCDATAIAVVTSNMTPPNISAVGGTLDCINSSVTIMGSSTTSNVSYAWTGPNGFTSTMQNPTVSESGEYTLTVTAPNACTATATAQVSTDAALPNVTATGGTLNCASPSLIITGSSATPNVTFAWTGPNGFTSTMQNPTVSEVGEYILSVTASNGCLSVAVAQVNADVSVPDISVEGGILDCTNNSIEITGSSTTSGVTYTWTGPGGFTSTLQNPLVTESGDYVLIVTGPNGCTSTATAQVTTDGSVPDISVSGGTIDCLNSSVTITGNSTTSDVTYAWTGPGGFTSVMQSFSITETGDYVLTVTAPNGCASTSTAQVVSDTLAPDIFVEGGTLDCANSSVMLIGSSMVPDVAYVWSGPDSFTTTVQNPIVSAGGEYLLSITAPNGCTNMSTTEILIDTMPPSVTAVLDSIDCDSQSVTLILSTDAESPTYSWTGPNAYVSTSQNPTITATGVYTYGVTGSNGCMNFGEYELIDIFNYTDSIVTTDATGAIGGTAEIIITGGTEPFIITWDNGEVGSETSDLSVGIHTVTVEDGLGCIKEFTFEILLNSSTSDFGLAENVFEVYPNPALDEIMVNWKNLNFQPTQISIINTTGRRVYSGTIDGGEQERVNLSGISHGVYFIELHNHDQNAISRLIVF